MKRTELKRHTPLTSSRARSRPKPTKYKLRERGTAYMLWIKTQRCIVQTFAELERYEGGRTMFVMTPCGGVVEADHMGSRGISRKALDNTCAPICTNHHRERGDFTGAFKLFKQTGMRAFLSTAIQWTQNRARQLGIVVPAC